MESDSKSLSAIAQYLSDGLGMFRHKGGNCGLPRTGSSTAFRHIAQTNIAEKVVLLAEAQMKSLPHYAIADGCRLLTLLCAGPRGESQHDFRFGRSPTVVDGEVCTCGRWRMPKLWPLPWIDPQGSHEVHALPCHATNHSGATEKTGGHWDVGYLVLFQLKNS